MAIAGIAGGAELRIGSAAVVITPALGTLLAGYYETRISDGVHDDLYAKAMVLECGGTRAAMVCCDLISMPLNVAQEARRLIEKDTGLKPDQVMISATHTHTGPILPGRTARETADGPGGDLAQEFVNELPARIAASVKQAVEKLAPATASTAIGREDHLSFNRRYIMKDGTVGWNPGKLNPKIDKPAGPIDPAVSVVYFEFRRRRPDPQLRQFQHASRHGRRPANLRRLRRAAVQHAQPHQGRIDADDVHQRHLRRHQSRQCEQ